ncbi:hypothetical protein [Haloarchaeobius sp. HRN-SO-5]|uniref:hypothetical protein n=1 Tax=Haloarchaeobius sp. HRN-SO-5 TaxID=3446118 RepID=UPI003EBA9F4D
MSHHRPVVLTVLSLLLLASTTAPVVAAPPPESVCGLCDGDAFDGAVERSEVDVQVRDDGSARWTVRATLDERTATELRDDPDRRQLVRRGLTRRSVVEEVRSLDTRVEGRDLVATFTVPGFAHRGAGGVLVVDGFFPSNQYASVTVHADRLTVSGPGGTAPTLVPETARAADGAVVWEGGTTDLGSETYLAFAGDGGVVATVTSYAVVGSEVLAADAAAVLPVAAGPVAVFAVALAGLFVAGDRLRPPDRAFDVRVAVVAAGATPAMLAGGVGLALLADSSGGALERPAFLLGVATAGLAPQVLVTAGAAATVAFARDRVTARGVPRWALVAGSVGWLLTVAATGPNRLFGAWATTSLLFLALGLAHARGDRTALPVAGVTLCAPVLATAPFTSPGWVPPAVLVVWTVVTLVCGVALYAVGRSVAAGPTRHHDGGADGRTAGAS